MIEIISDKRFYGPIITIILGIIIYNIGASIIKKINKIENKHIDNKKKGTIVSLIKNIYKYIIVIIVILIVLNIFGVNTTSILASLGVVGVVFGLAFQDIIKNLLSGISIVLDNKYSIGDNVLINDFRGEVISFGLQTTKIKAWTGEVLIINNSSITNIINYSMNETNLVIDVGVDYKTNLETLEKVLNGIKDKIRKLDNVVGDMDILGLDKLDNSAIIYRILIPCDPNYFAGIKRKVLKIIKIEFDKNNIIIPYNKLDINIERS